ncbi:MAG: 4-phosphoerythronate dehydrogenase [Bacteroidales bacterium]|jgi:erythronate-4-phosphate dehydrogenase
MKLVIDHKIPFIKGIFEPHAEVLYLPGGEIRREHLLKADCLLVRTRTQCDQKLLKKTNVKFIGTATIGFDHIDTKWCENNGIAWTNAPGCNSGAVMQYVTSALYEMARRKNFHLADKTLGIIGVGNVGKKIAKKARELGMTVILNDPPRQRTEGGNEFTDLTTLLKNADIITLHVPLNRDGTDKTIQMVDGEFLKNIKPGAILINSSRGEVIEEGEVLRELREVREVREVKRLGGIVMDVWQNEPDINRELMDLVDIATPHIAGYSVEGKYNATKIIVQEASRFFGIPLSTFPPLIRDGREVNQTGPMEPYDISSDDKNLRESPETFEQQRNNYPARWEFQSPCLKVS